MLTVTPHPGPAAPPLAYTVYEVAEQLRLSKDKVYALVRAGILPHKRIGRRIIIPRQAFEVWLNSADEWESFDAL